MKGLPPSWSEPTLSEIVADPRSDIVDGPFGSNLKATEYQDRGVPIIRLQNVDRNRFIDKNIRYVSLSKADELERHSFIAGDIAVTKLGEPLGKAAIIPSSFPRGVIVADIVRIRLDPAVADPRYITYALNSPQVIEQLARHTKGTTRPRVNLGHIRSLRIPLAPRSEQTRIADKLDRLLAAVDTCKARLDAIPGILKRFRQSVLAAGTCGVFTRNFRPRAIGRVSPVVIGPHDQSEDIPSGWRWELLKNLARLESGHTPRKSVAEYWEGGDVPWISLRDIRAAHGKIITQTESMPTMLGINNSSARLLPAGTVCFSRDISVGFTTIMGREMATTQHFANWICGDSLNNKYLMFALMAAAHHLTISGQGTTVKTIYMPALEDFRVLLPPLLEQVEIVAVIESLLGIADELEARLKCASSRIRGIAGSTLAKAFKGQLCATDSDGARTVAAFKACAGAV